MEIFIDGELFSESNLNRLKINLNKVFAYLIEDVCLCCIVSDKTKIEKAFSYFIRTYNESQDLFEVSVTEATKEAFMRYRFKMYYKSKGLLSLNKRIIKINYYLLNSCDEEVINELKILKQKIESTKGKKWSEVKNYVIAQERKADFIYDTYSIW